MALVESRADDRGARVTAPRLTCVTRGARIAVAARRTIGLIRIAANARRRIARAGRMALIERRAHHRVATHTRAGLASVRLGAGIPIVARRAVRLIRVAAHARLRITRSNIVALVQRRTDDGVHAGTGSRMASVPGRARALIVACRTIGLVWVAADTRRHIAHARGMALVDSLADLGRPGYAASRLARVSDGAAVAVAARSTVGLGRIAAHARERVTVSDRMALIECRALHEIGANAGADLAGVRLAAGVAVVTRVARRRPATPVDAGASRNAASLTVVLNTASTCGVTTHAVRAES